DTYDFAWASKIVDVGGAHGALLAAMLRKQPEAAGVLFDLPHVTPGAKQAIEKLGLAAQVEVVSGDFFKSVPTGGDLYLLKHILHDWDDAHAVAILKTVRAAMTPTSRVLVVEFALPEGPEPSPAHLMDLNMLVMLEGRERTVAEYGALFERAGLKLAHF